MKRNQSSNTGEKWKVEDDYNRVITAAGQSETENRKQKSREAVMMKGKVRQTRNEKTK